MILNFFQRVMELKTVPRQGWKNKLGLNDVESVAEHTYSTAILSMIFSDLHGFDTEKIIKMALIHDLAESVIGDLTPNQIPKNKKNKLENTAMKQILKSLPKKISNDYYHIWDEYQKKSSNESIDLEYFIIVSVLESSFILSSSKLNLVSRLLDSIQDP